MSNIQKEIVIKFNQSINNQNINELSQLITLNHKFIDSENNTFHGKQNIINIWKSFFKSFPDYKNHFSKLITKDNKIIIIGKSTCSNKILEGPAIWKATLINNLIDEWRVYDDSFKNRKELEI